MYFCGGWLSDFQWPELAMDPRNRLAMPMPLLRTFILLFLHEYSRWNS